jgi:hypothetical protein
MSDPKYTPRATYTDAELLALFREAYARIATSGESYTIGSRSYSSANLTEIRDQIQWLEQRVAGALTDATAGPTHTLVRPRRAT